MPMRVPALNAPLFWVRFHCCTGCSCSRMRMVSTAAQQDMQQECRGSDEGGCAMHGCLQYEARSILAAWPVRVNVAFLAAWPRKTCSNNKIAPGATVHARGEGVTTGS